jgi:hypothetical protein
MMVNASKDWIQQIYVEEISKKKSPPLDYYKNKDGNIVMTEDYHKKRGFCCGSKCLHCPYEPIYTKYSTRVNESRLKS